MRFGGPDKSTARYNSSWYIKHLPILSSRSSIGARAGAPMGSRPDTTATCANVYPMYRRVLFGGWRTFRSHWHAQGVEDSIARTGFSIDCPTCGGVAPPFSRQVKLQDNWRCTSFLKLLLALPSIDGAALGTKAPRGRRQIAWKTFTLGKIRFFWDWVKFVRSPSKLSMGKVDLNTCSLAHEHWNVN